MKRLPKGFGSICKLSGPRRNPYAARVKTGYSTESGAAEYSYIGYFPTRKAALEALTDFHKSPYRVDKKDTTPADLWPLFQARKFPNVSESRVRQYAAAWEKLLPLQDLPIRGIRPYQIQSLFDAMTVGAASKRHAKDLLSQLFRLGIELDIVDRDQSAFVKIETGEKSTKHRPFTRVEIETLFQVIPNDPIADTVALLIYTGLRPSELLDIRRESVHIEAGYLTGGMKTKAGKNRVIPIHSRIAPLVSARANRSCGYLIEDKGKPVSYQKYARLFRALMERLGMEHLPHDGRHTFASLADSAGISPVVIKKIMGHVSSDITESVYTHKGIEELREQIERIK